MANKDLLPPDDTLLLPADEAGRKDDVFDQMSVKVAAGAKVLGAKASEIAAQQGPVLKDQAHKLGVKMLDAAGQARDRAEEALKDPALRRSFWQSYKRRILIGAGAFVLVAGAAYGFGVHQETATARDAVEAYLIRSHLRQQVGYRDVSATPFGPWRLSDVKLSAPQSPSAIEIASLSVSGLEADGHLSDRLALSWSGLAFPADRLFSGDELAAFAGSGLQKLRGEGGFDWRFDARTGELELTTSGSFADVGSWDFAASFTGFPVNGAHADPFAILTEAGLAALLGIELKSLTGSLDLSGLAKREAEIPRTNMPAESAKPLFEFVPAQVIPSLIEAGMSPADARESAAALEAFAKTGHRLTLKSNGPPVRLMREGNFLVPATLNLPGLMAAMKLS